MAIVPSGKRRFMKLQQQYNVTDQEGDATQSEVVDSGTGESGGKGPAVDFNQLKQDIGNQSVTGPHYGEEDFQAAAKGGKLDSPVESPDDVEQSGDDLGKKGANIRGYVFQLLEQLGAPPRLIMENPDTFFQGQKDLDTGTITGKYILPSYTAGKKIPQDEAENIAKQIGDRFGLSQRISPKGNNFEISFQTREMVMEEDHGTSLQELVKSPGGKGGKGQPGAGAGAGAGAAGGMARAAQTQSEMIKASQAELFKNLRKKGFGGK